MRNGTGANEALLPILVGVSGHRDIPEEHLPAIKDVIRKILEDLKQRNPNAPLVLLSPLAEGADRIVAEVVLETDGRLVVPLPFSREEYERDFGSPSSVEAFRLLLSRADFISEIPLEEGSTPDSIHQYGAARNLQYLAVGRFIVRKCQVMIALWDGDVMHSKLGGTADVVRLQLTSETNRNDELRAGAMDLFHPVQTGPVLQVMVPRSSHVKLEPVLDEVFFKRHLAAGTPIQASPLSVNRLLPSDSPTGADPDATTHWSFADGFKRFNEELLERSERISASAAQSKTYLFEGNPPSSMSPPVAALSDRYAIVDALAIQRQGEVHRTLKAIAFLIPVIVFFFEIYTGISSSLLVIGGYLSGLAAAYGVYFLAQRQKIQEKYLDYRAMAEGLRVQVFWRMAGLSDSAADHYLGKQRTELDWIRHAIGNWDLLAGGGARREESTPETREKVLVAWVRGQAGYFRKTVGKQKGKAENLERISGIMLKLATFLMLPSMLVIHGFQIGGADLDSWMQAMTPMFFVSAAAIGYFSEKMLFSSQAKQYSRMAELFGTCERLLKGPEGKCRYPDGTPPFEDILLHLGKEALTENGDWVLMHRDRPIEVPKD